MTTSNSSAPHDLVDVISHVESPALVLDEDLRILASNASVGRLTMDSTTDMTGIRCHEFLDVTDSVVGQPCLSTCPIRPGRPRIGWSHSRVVEVAGSQEGESGPGDMRDCLVVRCATVGGEQANLCLLGRPLVERSVHLARQVRLFESLRDAELEDGGPLHTARLCLEAALSAAGGKCGEVFIPEAMAEPEAGPRTDSSTEPVVEPMPVAEQVEIGSPEGRPGPSARNLRQSLFGGRLPAQFLRDGLPLLASVRPLNGETAVQSGIYICAPIISDGGTVGSIGIYGGRSDLDVVTALRTLSAVAEFLGERVARVRRPYPRNISDPEDAYRYDRARLRIHVMGSLRVEVDGVDVAVDKFQRSRSISLLKLLATGRRQPVSRAVLREMFWPDVEREKAGTSLRAVLHDLRRSLRPATGPEVDFVVSQHGMIGFDTTDLVWVDSEEMDRKVATAHRLTSQGRVGEAVREYLVAASLFDFDPPFDEQERWWSHSRAATLQEVYESAIESVAKLLTADAQASEATQAFQATIEDDPCLRGVERRVLAAIGRIG